ncbi:hypothetical protein AOLI_G00062780 [Acnodon oligacanthus]
MQEKEERDARTRWISAVLREEKRAASAVSSPTLAEFRSRALAPPTSRPGSGVTSDWLSGTAGPETEREPRSFASDSPRWSRVRRLILSLKHGFDCALAGLKVSGEEIFLRESLPSFNEETRSLGDYWSIVKRTVYSLRLAPAAAATPASSSSFHFLRLAALFRCCTDFVAVYLDSLSLQWICALP